MRSVCRNSETFHWLLVRRCAGQPVCSLDCLLWTRLGRGVRLAVRRAAGFGAAKNDCARRLVFSSSRAEIQHSVVQRNTVSGAGPDG